MGLAASQVRLLTLTSDKLYLEKQISVNTNRKMALTSEMSRLAFEKNRRLNQYEYQVSTLDGGMQEISYQYLMGKSGGVQDISTKSEDKMMLFEASTGKVVLSADMANKIGSAALLRTSQDEKYAAIARLCGAGNLTVPDVDNELYPTDVSSVQFCVGTDLVKAILDGKYDMVDSKNLTQAINKYDLYYYDGNAVNSNTATTVPTYRILTEAGYDDTQVMNVFENMSTSTQNYGGRSWEQWYNYGDQNPRNLMLIYRKMFPHNRSHQENSDTANEAIRTAIMQYANAYASCFGYSSYTEMPYAQEALDNTANAFSDLWYTDQYTKSPYYGDNYFVVESNSMWGNPDYNLEIALTSSCYTWSHHNGDNTKAYMFASDYMDAGINTAGEQIIDHPHTSLSGVAINPADMINYFTASIRNNGADPTQEQIDAVQGNAYTYTVTRHVEDEYLDFCPKGNISSEWISSFNKLVSDVKFYAPIVDACSKFGYTTGYDDFLNQQPSYVDDSLQNGTFVIMDYDSEKGQLDGTHNTKYYLMFSEIFKSAKAQNEVEVQAWYQKEKNSIKFKEDVMDTMIEQMSAELSSINTEIESIQSLIDDSKKKFEWGNA